MSGFFLLRIRVFPEGMRNNSHFMRLSSVTFAAAALLISSGSILAQQDKTHLGGRPSDMVTLFADVMPGTTSALEQFGSDGNSLGNFTLPPKTALVITDLVVAVNLVGNPGQTRGGLINQAGSGDSRPYFSFDTAQQTSQVLHFTTGVVWSQVPKAINAPDSSSRVFVNVYGYLVKN